MKIEEIKGMKQSHCPDLLETLKPRTIMTIDGTQTRRIVLVVDIEKVLRARECHIGLSVFAPSPFKFHCGAGFMTPHA